MFPEKIHPNDLNSISKNTLLSHLGIEFSEIKEDYIIAKMPVNANTSQPMGILHGGASVTLAESIGSIGSHLIIDNETENAVGVEINANHISSAKEGYVTGKGIIIHKGKSTHIWSIDIRDQDEKLISTSRLTVMILKKSKK
jgi:1,4-dihydroxy-2-naphthoyl-CoA hydrolase